MTEKFIPLKNETGEVLEIDDSYDGGNGTYYVVFPATNEIKTRLEELFAEDCPGEEFPETFHIHECTFQEIVEEFGF